MSDFSTVPTVELLTRAADAAGKAAAATEAQEPWQAFVRDGDWHIEGGAHVALVGRITWPGTEADARLIAASGPDHWRAVEALLRTQLAIHDRYWAPHREPEHHCRHGYIVCESIAALRPLAEQVLRDLGDTE